MDTLNTKTTSELAIDAYNNLLLSYISDERQLEDPENIEQKLKPIYDSDLSIENRFQYKFSQIPLIDRKKPWHILIWNIENGIQHSDFTSRRWQTGILNEDTTMNKYSVTFVDLVVTNGILSNSMLTNLELQEVLMLNLRNRTPVLSSSHYILDEFEIVVNDFQMDLSRVSREKSSLSLITCRSKLTYPIIGMGSQVYRIETINANIYDQYTEELLTEDVIDENS